MLLLPIVGENSVSLLIVLEDDNLERIQRYDQAEVNWSEMPYRHFPLRTIAVGYATPADILEIHRLAAEGKIHDCIKLVTRGWEFRPDLGDHDRGPQSLLGKKQ